MKINVLLASAVMMLLFSCLQANAAAIRPGPPPDPHGIGKVGAVERLDTARKPGPPPDPLREDGRG